MPPGELPFKGTPCGDGGPERPAGPPLASGIVANVRVHATTRNAGPCDLLEQETLTAAAGQNP